AMAGPLGPAWRAADPRIGPAARSQHDARAPGLGDDLGGERDAFGADPHARPGDKADAAGRIFATERALLGGPLPPAPALPAGADVALKLFLDGRDADVQLAEHAPGPRSGIQGQRAQQVLGADIAKPGPPGQTGRPFDRRPRLRRLRRRLLTGLAAAREHHAGGLAHVAGLDTE